MICFVEDKCQEIRNHFLFFCFPSFVENRQKFIKDLKQKYENQYQTVQPIPYIRDRLYCVDRVFVEGGIEYLVAKKIIGEDDWDPLQSYQDIFNDPRVISNRRTLEGDPGYGKSTVTLQIAYDWCNSTPGSYLHKFEILILIRLRQLRGVTSIYSAVRLFILPKDSTLSEDDVKYILQSSSSVLIVLDGFDEYPDQDSKMSDIISIIRRDMFYHFDVLVTTRTACLPNELAPQTQRIRLTGFDERARDEYIRKAVVGNNDVAARKIKQQLKVSSVLADVCQVPLFFVMFAHMSHESDLLKKFNSVTHFFGYMMGCFHSHLKNKGKDTNTEVLDSTTISHTELDKVSFDALRGKNQQLVWEKNKLREQLGKKCYEIYVRLGILVEEEALDLESFSGIHASSKHIKEKTEVRFYHKLFCEWFAAHHLSNLVCSNKVSAGNQTKLKQSLFRKKALCDILDEFDPFDLQYIFRFSCGLNADAAEKIIKYLKAKKTSDRFAVLCILEREGEIGKILETVRDLCSNTIRINADDSLLLQRSTIDLMELASSNSVPIAHLYLSNCCSTVDLTGGSHLQLKSNLPVPALATLKELSIHESGREITSEEFKGILEYSSKCLELRELW
ncbi:NLR family CARD domain-containing protein 4 [Holothuria leucospilota]|uniref:NLR family CARD domain-containing protein 4 n=1 Tax=Holothuria leucospilota TaxID=206669 RepID=A0A9Q1CQ77_HOLLE|nr:NLR family CARD domain-containing protein 4 [Holothuria leucospilota]